VLLADPHDRIPVGGLPEEVDADDRGGQPPGAGAFVELLLEQGGVEVPARRLTVEEDRLGSDVGDRVGGRDERERGGIASRDERFRGLNQTMPESTTVAAVTEDEGAS
jgi:hypothetical protein